MLCPNVSAKSLRVLPRSFEVASFDVDVFFIAETRGSLDLDFYMFGGKHG